MKEGGGGEGERERERALGLLLSTAHDIEVDPQRRRFGCRESDFALHRLVECRALKRNESEWLRCDDIPAAVQCASVSRWACRKRRRKNSPCMRVLVLTMARRKEMF